MYKLPETEIYKALFGYEPSTTHICDVVDHIKTDKIPELKYSSKSSNFREMYM